MILIIGRMGRFVGCREGSRWGRLVGLCWLVVVLLVVEALVGKRVCVIFEIW